MGLQFKRGIHKSTGYFCTILKAQSTCYGTRYTVHFDHQHEGIQHVILCDDLVILGEVQSGGVTRCL